jgi:hypothetical protein
MAAEVPSSEPSLTKIASKGASGAQAAAMSSASLPTFSASFFIGAMTERRGRTGVFM